MYQTAQQAGTGQTVMTQVQLQPGHHPQPTGAAQQIMTANGQLIQVGSMAKFASCDFS